MMALSLFLAQAQQPEGPPLQPLPHPELPDPSLVLPGPAWWIYLLAGLLVIGLLGLVVWLLLRPAKVMPLPLPRPWSTAMDQLRDLLTQVSLKAPSQIAAEVSETLRQYFLQRYKIPAPFRTSQELFERQGIPATSLRLQKYGPLAELWDQLAFAPVPTNPEEAANLVKQAIAHLEEDRL
jgi:Domain of unknown function (DUF4381)